MTIGFLACVKGCCDNLNYFEMFAGKWLCPWHHCDVCGARAVKLCGECPNSFCSSHITSNIFELPGKKLVCSDHTDILATVEESKLVTPSIGTGSSCESSSNQSDSDASTVELSSTSRSSSVSSRRSERSVSKPVNNALGAGDALANTKNSAALKTKSTNGKRQAASAPLQGSATRQNSKNATAAGENRKRVTRKASSRMDDSPMFDDKEDDCFPDLVIDIPSI